MLGNMQEIKAGRRISFAIGRERTIINIRESEQHLTVLLNGNPLDGEQVGFPSKGFNVLK
jgi:hypothetical protein